MKFYDLSGKEYSKEINLSKYKIKEESKSKDQKELGEKLQDIFPLYNILEEFPCVGENLYLDFFIPFIRYAFEYDGEQHDKYNKHFHRTVNGFAESIMRDHKKARWCEINNIKLFTINSENIENIGELINE